MLKQANCLYGPDDSMMPVRINLGNFLVKGFKKHGDKVAMMNAETEEQITYNEMVQAAMNVAVSLVRLGVKKGDVVGICSESRLENWPTVLGIASTGAVITPISTAYIKDELKHVLNISKPSYLFCSKQTYQMHEAVFKSVECIKEIIFFDEERPKGALYYKDLAIVSDDSMIKENVNIEDFLAVEVDGVADTAFIMYSSGTTGLPKGVMLSHLNIIATCTIFKNLRDVYQGYGMTEITLLISLSSYMTGQKCKPGSVGKISYNTILKIVDVETRKPLGPYESGEICFKSPSVMKGYIGRDKSEDFDDEGFLKTGDIGYYDDEKYLFIVDRLKELIKYKGYQVPPAEIETLLLQHPGVRDVGVVGLPQAAAGEVPLAFVVPQPGVCLLEAELQKFVADRLSNPKHLRGGVRFVDNIPRNPSGKILRKNLREMLEKEKNIG
ncbi:Luciferin 4-monooxygenase [Papilio xuthus]|uniref:Luciferin 4-monooxygenase n=1 Tax=Papilio xuthus TaxID=66420 RepID=A0A194PTD5_PAPXU|nr:Luciferin 4-monooxygenase [Papilio xuthus]